MAETEVIAEPPGLHELLQRAARRLLSRSVVSVGQLATDEIVAIVLAAQEVKRRRAANDTRLRSFLEGKVVLTAFFEPSTRTRCSFEAAALRLGAGVISNPDLKAASSVKKGESLEDTMRIFASYADAVIMRHPERGSCELVASSGCGFGRSEASAVSSESSSSTSSKGSSRSSKSSSVLISGGDGSGEHPTQALLDLFTIAEANPRWFNAAAAAALGAREGPGADSPDRQMTVAFVGDLKYGRTVHSLALVLARFGVRLFFVSPLGLNPDKAFVSQLESIFKQQGLNSEAFCCFSPSLKATLPLCDILYVTRLQRERLEEGGPGGPPPATMEGAPSGFCVNAPLLRAYAKPHLKVLHPLPRVDELSPCVDSTQFARFFEQAENGVYVRMALLTLCLVGPEHLEVFQ
ncbi:hypothetical protein Efla_005302 [Eimeria flavescens]